MYSGQYIIIWTLLLCSPHSPHHPVWRRNGGARVRSRRAGKLRDMLQGRPACRSNHPSRDLLC